MRDTSNDMQQKCYNINRVILVNQEIWLINIKECIVKQLIWNSEWKQFENFVGRTLCKYLLITGRTQLSKHGWDSIMNTYVTFYFVT